MKREVQGISAVIIEEQLKRIQGSPLFSHSRRYPSFLDYVVRKTLEGLEDELKERTVGIEAFGRSSGYDLNADPIVRVTAGEVRKRLAQYYYQSDHQLELRIELHPGSYIPEFRFADKKPAVVEELPGEVLDTAPAATAPFIHPPTIAQPALAQDTTIPGVPLVTDYARAGKWKSIAALLAVALSIATVGAIRPLLHRTSPIDAFWLPVIDANGPVLISVGSVVAMVNSNAVAPPSFSISGHPLSSDPIAVSDAVALSSIQQVLSIRSKSSTLESSTSTSFSDLQKGPVVLISGFNNQWTMRISDPLHFHFVRTTTDEYSIQDRTDPSHHQWTINTATPFVKMNYDFGIVARFHDPITEQIVVVAAGIGENGTIAASRVLTDEKYLSELKRDKRFPRFDQNFECVVETQIIDGKPGPPRIVATYFW